MSDGTTRDELVRVCVDARIRHESVGGALQALSGLAAGLRTEVGRRDDVRFLVHDDMRTWIGKITGIRDDSMLPVPAPATIARALTRLSRAAIKNRPALGRLLWRIERGRDAGISGPLQEAGIDVLHQYRQYAFESELPTIYQPHDLQHRHLPEMFGAGEIRYRDDMYRHHCHRAHAVVAMTYWGKMDLVRQYGLSPSKVHVIPLAPFADGSQDLAQDGTVVEKRRWPSGQPTIFYPAQHWPHKNHVRLIQSLDVLRERFGIRPRLVLTGSQFPEVTSRIHEAISRYKLDEQVAVLGFVSKGELEHWYRKADALVFPSLFEGWGMPLLEAMSFGVPVACSTSSCLPEVAGSAALFFDPDDPHDIASTTAKILNDGDVRDDLIREGLRRARNFNWQRTATNFLALYRHVADAPLDADQSRLLRRQLERDPLA